MSGNNLDEELKEPGSLETPPSDTTVPPDVAGASNGGGSPGDSIRPQSFLPHPGVLGVDISSRFLLISPLRNAEKWLRFDSLKFVHSFE